MLGSMTSEWTSRIGAAWERLPGQGWRRGFSRYAPVAASVAVNGAILLALTAAASSTRDLTPAPITLELVSSLVPRPDAVMPPPPKQRSLSPPRPRSTAPIAPPGPLTAPPLTLPNAAQGAEPGVETIPADIGAISPVIPRGLQKFLEADPCIDANTRKLHPECKSTLRAATDAIPERQARAARADRLVTMAKELGVYDNCQSSHMGCASPSDRTLAGAAIARATTRGRSPMGAGGPTGMPGPELRRPNGYHVDPGFGD
jgi:hypothetical protein